VSLKLIEQSTKEFAGARAVLRERLQTLNDEIAAAKRKAMPGLRKAIDIAAALHASLREIIGANAGLFERPRTQIFHGVKVGYRKMKGEISWEDDGQVVKLIRKHCPERLDSLVKTVETPLKDALAQLPADLLKKLGVSVENDADEVYIKCTDSEIDKAVNALLKDAVAEEIEA
jgi:Gam-like protein